MRLKRSAEFAGVVGKAAKLGHRMYETAFGLHRHPFQASDNRRPFYVSSTVRNLIPHVLHALRTDLGVAVLTGPAGSGKTAFLRHLKHLLSAETRIVQCSAAAMDSVPSLWDLIGSAPAVPRGASSSSSSPTTPLTLSGTRWNVVDRLQKSAELWGPLLLLIDDAHLLPVPVLHELRALLEEPSAAGRLIRCLVAGPLNLEEEFARPSHADFSGMIRCHVFLHPLTSVEAAEYLETQLRCVGGETTTLFDREAIEFIVTAADGLPRCINLLADESFVVGFESGKSKIDSICVSAALERLRHLPYSWNVSAVSPSVNPDAAGFKTGTVFSTDGNTAVVEIGGEFQPLAHSRPVDPPNVPALTQLESPTEPAAPSSPPWQLPIEQPDSAIEFAEFHETSEYCDTAAFCDSAAYCEADAFGEPDAFGEAGELCPTTRADEAILHQRTLEDWPDIDDVPESSQGEGFRVPSSAETAAEFVHLEGTNRLPVFDRYTWIELNREVASGDHALVSARQRRLSEIDQISVASILSRPQSGLIPVAHISEQEMSDWLARGPSIQDPTCSIEAAVLPICEVQPINAVEMNQQIEADGGLSGQDQPESDEQFFFSLPIPIDSTVSSRRTVVAQNDGVLPLATSIANLQQEVRTFNRVPEHRVPEHRDSSERESDHRTLNTAQPQPYVVGSLLREAMSRIESVEDPGDAPVALETRQETRPVSADRTTRFSSLFTSLRSSRKSDDR
ncbi:MAG: AAA family ATPase [Planctomyces sp.]|nr:AAA family ATPase [Planctomyces sp.]